MNKGLIVKGKRRGESGKAVPQPEKRLREDTEVVCKRSLLLTWRDRRLH